MPDNDHPTLMLLTGETRKPCPICHRRLTSGDRVYQVGAELVHADCHNKLVDEDPGVRT